MICGFSATEAAVVVEKLMRLDPAVVAVVRVTKDKEEEDSSIS